MFWRALQQLPPATPVVLWAGGPFFERAVEHRRHKGPVDGTFVLGTAAFPPLFAALSPGTACRRSLLNGGSTAGSRG